VVGDIEGNAAALQAAYDAAVAEGADLVAAGELAIPGYPPEDLVRKPAFVAANERALHRLAQQVGRAPFVVGFVESLEHVDATAWRRVSSASAGDPPLANSAAVLRDGAIVGIYRKQRLPNYGVFDEARYFCGGTCPLVLPVAGTRVGITVCEDLWGDGGPVQQAADAGAELIVNINASPYSMGKRSEREDWARNHAKAGGVWIAYVNEVAGQDEIVFDGDSFILSPTGRITARGNQFATGTLLADLPLGEPSTGPAITQPASPRLEPAAEVYAALVLGTRDYVIKNGFSRALVGVSGGIDSALVATIAVDALGAQAVTGVAMPSPWSSSGSLIDAKALAANLGIHWLELPIERAMDAFSGILAEPFAGSPTGLAEENLQARIRGTLLMALSNKNGDMVLATGNKSEYAVGFSTLYGDMAGGFAVLKDVPKTLVYELARWRNTRPDGELIPQATIAKPPSAELRPGQRDTDSLPPYEVLDPLLEALVVHERSIEEVIGDGFDEAVVRQVFRMVDRAEYKRRQAAPGVKITERAFGRDRRLPITHSWTG